MNRKLVIEHLEATTKWWTSHTDLRLAVGGHGQQFSSLMSRMVESGIVLSENTRTGRWYRLASKPPVDLCSIPWLGTWIQSVPKGEGIVHRIDDDGEVE